MVGARASEPKVVATKVVSGASMHQPAASAGAPAQAHETHQSDSSSNNSTVVAFSLVIALLSAVVAGVALAKTMGAHSRHRPRHTRVRVEPDPSEVELQGVKPLLVQQGEYKRPVSASLASVVVGQALPAHSTSVDETFSIALNATSEEPIAED